MDAKVFVVLQGSVVVHLCITQHHCDFTHPTSCWPSICEIVIKCHILDASVHYQKDFGFYSYLELRIQSTSRVPGSAFAALEEICPSGLILGSSLIIRYQFLSIWAMLSELICSATDSSESRIAESQVRANIIATTLYACIFRSRRINFLPPFRRILESNVLTRRGEAAVMKPNHSVKKPNVWAVVLTFALRATWASYDRSNI